MKLTDLGVNTAVLLDVVEGVLHESAHAAVGGVVAVDDVLLAQRHQLAGLLEVLALERSSGAESPARAALALVLNTGNVSLERLA